MNRFADWWLAGGPILWLIAALAVVLFSLLAERLLSLWRPATWSRHREGELRAVLSGEQRVSDRAALIGLAEQPQLTRNLSLIRACIVTAPLLGLLGTVSGIISTFDTILIGGAGSELGAGIAQALVTTQLGLAVAVPGLLCERIITRRAERIATEQVQIGAALAAGAR